MSGSSTGGGGSGGGGQNTAATNILEASAIGQDQNLIDHLRSFLHLTTQAPLEYVCRSALYLLTHVPSTRHAVLEYIGTFYKVATFLHLRFNLNQKNPNYTDLTTDTSNINHISQVIELVDTSLTDLLKSSSNNVVWSVELTQWLVELLGDIVLNTGNSFSETPGLTSEEIASLRSLSIVDGLELWSNQCRPTQSILLLLRNCFVQIESHDTRSNILDIILEASTKYSTRFDWTLCYLTSLDPDFMFEKLLTHGFKEYQAQAAKVSPSGQSKLPRISVINFYANSYPYLISKHVINFINSNSQSDERKIFTLKVATQSPGFLLILMNKLFDMFDDTSEQLMSILKSLMSNEHIIKTSLFECLTQINNSVAVYDLIINFLEWMSIQNSNKRAEVYFKTIIGHATLFLETMISNVYSFKTQPIENTLPTLCATEKVPFLKSLNGINGISYKSLSEKIIDCLKHEKDHELLYKLTLLMMIITNEHKAGLLMNELLLLENKTANKTSYTLDECILVKLRQEINPFHVDCFNNSIKSTINYFSNLTDKSAERKLNSFVNNLVIIYEWDIHNKCFMNQNLSTILVQRECFTGLISQINLIAPQRPNYTLTIMELYNRIFKLDDDDLNLLKLNVADLVNIAYKFVNYFFELTKSINEENVLNRIKEVTDLITLVENTLTFQHNIQEDNNPYRNILLRTLTDKIFEFISNNKKSQLLSSECDDQDYFDENSNLFSSNIEAINNDIITNKSRLKAVRNSLVNYEFSKKFKTQKMNQFKNLKNYAILDLLESVCSASSFENNETYAKKRLISEQMSNLSELLNQYVLLDQHFVDYTWAASILGDIEENLDNELDAIKIFIERDMSVQNKFENTVDNQIMWMLLEFVANDEMAFIRVGPIVRSLLASVIIQWESLQETSTRNNPKSLGITLRLLNIINRVPNLLPKPFCYIVDLIPLVSSYETYILLLIIWRNLRKKMSVSPKPMATNLLDINNGSSKNADLKHIRFIFQKNINKLAYLYSKFFKVETRSNAIN